MSPTDKNQSQHKDRNRNPNTKPSETDLEDETTGVSNPGVEDDDMDNDREDEGQEEGDAVSGFDRDVEIDDGKSVRQPPDRGAGEP